MPMTNGEKYGLFLLLAADRSALRRVVEGSQLPGGSTTGAPGPAADAATLQTRAQDAIVALGVDPANLAQPVNLAYLFDTTGNHNVTNDQATIALALALPYGGSCPAAAVQGPIFDGIKKALA